VIHVLATITATAGNRQALIAAFDKLRPEVLAEAGCIEYGTAVNMPTPIAAQQPLDDDTLMVVEKWASLDHLQAHLAAPHMEAFRTAHAGLIAGIVLQVLAPTSQA
jgi:quinol monooxygenase YgiN